DAKFTFLPFSVKPECYLIYLKSIGYVYGGAVKFCFLAYKARTASNAGSSTSSTTCSAST
ncbi:hypothetical protein JTM29_21260, partial [Pseudomonas aeruginosa]|nr:hypothetical protein [Pseudomonas aeruginosa]